MEQDTANREGTKRAGRGVSFDLHSLARVFTEASDPILILDMDGRVLTINAEAERTFGYDAVEIVGRPATTLVPEDRKEETENLFFRCIRGDRVRNVETMSRRKDGETFPVLTTLSLITDDAGQPVAATAIAKDITRLKRDQRALRAERARLAEDARLTTVSELAAGLAHELNQPLSAIAHYCDAALSVIKGSTPVDEDLAEVISEAYEQTQRAGDIIRSLRTLIGRRERTSSAEDLNTVVTDTTRFLMTEIRAHEATLDVSLESGLPRVSMDKVQIQQVVMNLILNALEAMERSTRAVRRLSLSTARVGHEAVVTVEDNGPGIDPELAATLYEPFQGSKPEGLGLGLWISRSIIDTHQGRIWSDGASPDGATFHFALPIAPSE